MTAPHETDVLVSGLGPAGAAVAIRLARAGHRVVALDRARFPRDKPCSEYMSPETLRQLALLGVLDRVERAGGSALAGARVIGPRGSELTGLFASAGVEPFRATGLSMSRRVFDQVLVDAAREAGVTVLEETRLLAPLRAGRFVGARVSRGGREREIRSRLLVGADGLHSRLAGALGRRRHGRPARYAFVGHVAGVPDMAATAEMHVGDRGYVGLNDIGGGLVNVAVVVPAERAAGAAGDPAGFWRAVLDSFPALRDRIPRRGLERPVLATGPFAAWSPRVVADGAMLVGDAADFFDPFTGEGICSALRSAALAAVPAAAALADSEQPTARDLQGYVRARRAAFRGKWAVERMIGWGMLAPALFDSTIERLERRGLAHTLVGVTGAFVPARAVLRPGFLAAVVIG